MDSSALVGIIPGAGDAADAALNYLLVVRKAKQAEYVPPQHAAVDNSH